MAAVAEERKETVQLALKKLKLLQAVAEAGKKRVRSALRKRQKKLKELQRNHLLPREKRTPLQGPLVAMVKMSS